MVIQENKIKVNKHELFYRYTGNGKEVIVLLHGIPTNSFLWMQIMSILGIEFHVIAPDLIGFGQSSRPINYCELTLPKQAEYIISLLDYLNIEKAHFIGHDLGGGITQILAIHYKERVSSIIIADGVAFSNWPIPRVVALRKPTAPEFEPNLIFIERMLRVGLYHQELATPDLVEAFTKPFDSKKGPKELQMAALALEHHQTEDLVPHLSKIKVKSTFIWGEHDRFLPAYWGYKLKDAIPNSMLTLIPEAGHFLMIDNPLAFSQEVLKHMEEFKM